MKKRYFWEKHTLKKFRIIFETAEFLVGVSRRNKYQTFRKDTGLIAYSKREVLEMNFADLARKAHLDAEHIEKNKLKFNESFGFNFG